MTRLRPLLVAGAALVLLLAALGGGVWWYLFGGNSITSAELVPADTIAFATVPNGATVAAGYQTSQLKTLADSPNTKPIFDWAQGLIGQKMLDVLTAFLPNLSGQSFIAVTHFDPAHPDQIGLIAAMKPKPGFGNFDGFVDKLKATWPETFKQGTTGTATVAGVDYRWAKGPGAQDKICVAQVGGWTVTAWGEAALQDWIERYHGASTTPSLAANADYMKSLPRVGANPMTLVYVNTGTLVRSLLQELARSRPGSAASLEARTSALGPLMMATRFENGEVVDRVSVLVPEQVRAEAGINTTPCAFDTLKFTGPDTRFYWGLGIDWKAYYKKFLSGDASTGVLRTPSMAPANALFDAVQQVTQNSGLDVQHNIIDPLGSELSVQVEWSGDSTYPSAGLLVKLDKPDDFQPTIKAIIEAMRQRYSTSAVINELASGGHKFASLNFIQSSAFSPTITEDGDYLGLFLTANQAVRSFQRDPSIGLTHNPDFTRQLGDRRNGAAQIAFLDSPRLLDRAYQSVSPYLSLAAMFNRDLAKMLAGRDMPQDLSWLAPMGTWAVTVTPDAEGVQVYSASGIGNQGFLVGGTLGATMTTLQRLGFMPKMNASVPRATPPGGALPSAPPTTNAPPAIPDATAPPTNAAPVAPAPPAPLPDATTNAAPATNAPPDTNAPAVLPPH